MTKFFFVLLLLLPTAAISQPMSTSLDIPFLTSGPSRPSGGNGMIVFDKRILVNVEGGSEPAEMCLYINTTTGDLGIVYGRAGELGLCELKVNDKKFRFMLVRSSGQVQTYTTTEKNGALKHYMMTGNSEVFPVNFPRMENTDLHRFGDVVPGRRRGGVESRTYRANASAPTYYLRGRTEPATVTTQNFLGYSGIGYLKTNRGIFMAVRAELGAAEFSAYTWHDIPTSLDPTPFEQMESIMNEKIIGSLDRQEEKLRNQSFSGGCAMEEEELRRMKLADVEARRGLNRERNTTGNVYESEPARRATSQMMEPNLAVMNQELVVKICKAEDRLTRTRSEASRAGIEERIRCYRSQQAGLSALQEEWNAIDARYPNNSGRAHMEKNLTFGRLASIGTACR